MRDGKVRYADTEYSSVDFIKAMHPQHDYRDFENLMRGYGFTAEWDINLLTSRYYYNQTIKQITDEHFYISPRTTRRRLKHLHELLKERGFPRRKI